MIAFLSNIDKIYAPEKTKTSHRLKYKYMSTDIKKYGVMDINPPKCIDIDYIDFLICDI